VRKCEVYRNHQGGLEARNGEEFTASENRIFDGGVHGILIGPDAGECGIDGNEIFENAREVFLLSKTRPRFHTKQPYSSQQTLWSFSGF